MFRSIAQYFFSIYLTPVCVSAILEFVVKQCDPKGCGIFSAITFSLFLVPSLFATLGFFLKSYKVSRIRLANGEPTYLRLVGILSAMPLAAWLIYFATSHPFYDQSDRISILMLLIVGPLLLGVIFGWLYCKKFFSAELISYHHPKSQL